MNWDVVKGNLTRAKGAMKAKWGELTDDEITEMEGSSEAMAGKLQAKYGMAKEDAESAVEEFVGELEKSA